MQEIGIEIKQWLMDLGLTLHYAILVRGAIIILSVILLSIIANFIAKKIIILINSRIIKKTKNEWNTILFRRKVFSKLSHIISALVFYFAAHFTLRYYPSYMMIVKSAALTYMIVVGLIVINSFINAAHDIYSQLPYAKNRPIKGYIQLVKIIIYFIGGILILSVMIGKSPITLLAGLGALAAVLLVVFKDTITGFVSSIQLSSNKMLNPGDYMVMPKYNIDGEVMEISLSTVKIRNYDQTITTIATHTLIAEPFTNLKGIIESGNRLIKRSVFIDIKTVRFYSVEMLDKIKENEHLRLFLKNNLDESSFSDKQLTNLGIFRKYLEFYLKQIPEIKTDMEFSVRHLQPTDKGIQTEIYLFCNAKNNAEFDNILSGIFEHILAIINEFGLKIFQSPSPEW